MKEKEPLSGSVDYGKDEDSTEALLKKQEALMSDLEAFESTIVALRDQALSCPVRWLSTIAIIIQIFSNQIRTYQVSVDLFITFVNVLWYYGANIELKCCEIFSKNRRYRMYLERNASWLFTTTQKSHRAKCRCVKEMSSRCSTPTTRSFSCFQSIIPLLCIIALSVCFISN